MTQSMSDMNEDRSVPGGSDRVKDMPADAETRRSIRAEARRTVAQLDRRRPLKRPELEELARDLLRRVDVTERVVEGFIVNQGALCRTRPRLSIPQASAREYCHSCVFEMQT